MKTPTALLLGLLLCATAARGQQEDLALDPPLSQALPLTAGPDGVHVQVPVLLNSQTVLRPAAQLRFVYIAGARGIRNKDDRGGAFRSQEGPHGTLTPDDTTGGTRHGESAGDAWGTRDTDDSAGIFDAKKDESKRGKKELQAEVWTRKDIFIDAFSHAADSGTTIVYSLPPQNRPLTAEIDLPEGLLLGEIDGHVRVLGVATQSRPYQAGVRPGDEIRSFGAGQPLVTLNDFTTAYLATKRQAKISGDASYVLNIYRASEGGVVPVRIAAPPSIPSFL